jgi:hypothetical protein
MATASFWIWNCPGPKGRRYIERVDVLDDSSLGIVETLPQAAPSEGRDRA